jgi:hypothetical protein
VCVSEGRVGVGLVLGEGRVGDRDKGQVGVVWVLVRVG